jgi:hypothetical protein
MGTLARVDRASEIRIARSPSRDVRVPRMGANLPLLILVDEG